MHAEGLDASEAEPSIAHGDAPGPASDISYYLNDFESVIRGVEQLYGVLLTEDERDYVSRLRSLSRPARCLYVRLVNRKGPYFRVQRLNYPEIGLLDAPLAELIGQRLVEHCTALPEGTRRNRLLACFTLPELVLALKKHPAPKFNSRAAMLDWLAAWESCGDWMAGTLAQHPVIGLPETDPWPFLRFLFFGELRANLSDFVTRALGHIVTERFDEAVLLPCFNTRAQAEDAYRMARLYREFADLRDTQPAIELLEWWRGHAIERHQLEAGQPWFDRLVDRLGRRLERAQQIAAAMALYATSPVAPARERLARLQIRAGYTAEAVALLREMAAAPCNPEEAYAARQLLARLEKKPRGTEAYRFQRQSRTITVHYATRSTGEPGMTVEAAVLAHYQAQGWQGVHAENWLWNASFGLLLWDIIYDPKLGVFHSPLQFAPSDLYSPEFYRRRGQAIETRLELLQQPAQALQVVTRHFEHKQGIANPFVGWHESLPEILAVMLERVPGDGHAAVLRHMARNLRHHAHGFLDLFIWNDRDYRFIEIKSANDRLAAHQFEWLRFFAEAGINVSLEKVERPIRGVSV